jgi:hypothetical protein
VLFRSIFLDYWRAASRSWKSAWATFRNPSTAASMGVRGVAAEEAGKFAFTWSANACTCSCASLGRHPTPLGAGGGLDHPASLGKRARSGARGSPLRTRALKAPAGCASRVCVVDRDASVRASRSGERPLSHRRLGRSSRRFRETAIPRRSIHRPNRSVRDNGAGRQLRPRRPASPVAHWETHQGRLGCQ